MNKALCKKRGRDPQKERASRQRYFAKFKQFNIVLHKDRDADIIAWFDKQENKQAAIRELIRRNA